MKIGVKNGLKLREKKTSCTYPLKKLHQLKYICGSHFLSKNFNKKKTQLRKNAVPSVRLSAEPLVDELFLGFPLHITKTDPTELTFIISKEHDYCGYWTTTPIPSTSTAVPMVGRTRKRKISLLIKLTLALHLADVKTDNDLQYQFFPVSSGSIRFKVQTTNDAHLALTMGPQESDPMYEIFIGGWNNTKSAIRRNKTEPNKVTIETPDIVSSDEFRGFWIRWDGGVVSAGREGVAIPFVTWTDPEPFPVAFVGICTAWEATGTWKIEVSPIILKEIDYKVLDGADLKWERVHNQILPLDAIIGGFENEPLFIARGEHNNSLTPGKYVRSKGKAFLAWGGREHSKTEFEVLCGYDYQWVRTTGHCIPENAFVAGHSEVRNEPVYVGRSKHDGFLITGKVHALYGSCYLPYQGREIEVGEYEILVKPSVITRGYFCEGS